MSEQNKVVRFKKRKSINIGVIVFLILFVYVAINVYIFFTKDQLSIYEVHEGSSAPDSQVTALVLRNETLVNADGSGYVSYYQNDGARIAKNTSVYSLSDSTQLTSTASSKEPIKLTKKESAEIKHTIRSFRDSYSDDNFASVYSFKEEMQSTVLDILNNDGQAAAGDSSAPANAATSLESGIITYYMDNFEAVSPNAVTMDMFQKDQYKKINLRTNEKVSPNNPVYKLITSDQWYLVFPLPQEQYDKIKDKKTITFTVVENDVTMTASLSTSQKGTNYFAILTMNKDLSDYLGDRYLDIEYNVDSEKGLKIPISSIVEKDFYKVPNEYFTQGADSTDIGVTKITFSETGDESFTFVPTDIYYKDDTYSYIDAQLFPADTQIQSTEKSDRYKLSEISKLTGVYNVNQGYAIFKRIEIISQDKEYCIIKSDTSYGLSAYDHIALNGKTAVDQAIIY